MKQWLAEMFNTRQEEKKMAEYEELHGDNTVVKAMRVRPSYQTWPEDPIESWTEEWRSMKNSFELFLQSAGIYTPIDEVALLFEDDVQKIGFIRDAVKSPTVKLFNSAWDHVTTSPIESDYFVEYDFLEVEGLKMRVEAMRIDRGYSPLHEALLRSAWVGNILPTVVHLSFKIAAKDYEKVRDAMVGKGATLVQACESDYGKFAYYNVPGFEGIVYLKPRVNVRDEPEPVEPDTPLPNTDDLVHPFAGAEFGHPGIGGGYLDALSREPRPFA